MKIKRLLFALICGIGIMPLSLWFLSFGSSTTYAAVINNVDTFDDELNNDGDCSLREAIQSANTNATVDNCVVGNGDDSIVLPAGVFTLTRVGSDENNNAGDLDITDTNALTITGAGQNQTIINANGIDRVFDIWAGTVVISGVTLINGRATGSGGGIQSTFNTDLILINTVISNSIADSGGGGGIAAHGPGRLVLNGGQIISNSANSTGGGGLSVSIKEVTLNGVRISSNVARWGGGIYIAQSKVTFNAGEIINNTIPDDHGGGVYVDANGVFTQTGESIIAYNSVGTGTGGGMAVEHGGKAFLLGGNIISNSAVLGGGVYILQGDVILSGGRIINNSATWGGGVYVEQGGILTQINTGSIAYNTSSAGGGVYVNADGTAVLMGGGIVSNTADSGGGVLVGGKVTLSGGQIISNSANFGGGVFIVTPSAFFTQTAVSTIAYNSAMDGGGVYVNSGKATLYGGQVIYNTGIFNGGGLYQSDGTVAITDSCIVGNSATSVYYNGGTSPLVATNNWWGASDGPSGVGLGHGDTINSDILFSPFLTASILGCPTLYPVEDSFIYFPLLLKN